jgi:Kef-type K+ transport system membrane component KefB
VAWLASVGTALPFVIAVLVAPMLPLHVLVGPANHRVSLILVIGIAVAVTSIPLIAKIFHDLQILHTRFARLILSVAVLEDILLWAVLAVATALAASGPLPAGGIVTHVATTALYFALGMLVVPPLLRSVSRASSNVLVRNAPVAYVVMMLFAYTAAAAALDVNLVFAAFLAGYAVGACGELTEASASLNKVSFAVFIPVYFAVVGYQLDLTKTFSPALLTAVLVGACAIKLVSAGVGASLAGFNWRDSVNLSVALNARGGPGIVLASVAYEARIINGDFYTSLVILAVLTSQAAGAWLDHVLKRGWPLLTEPSRSAFSVEPRLKGESSAV